MLGISLDFALFQPVEVVKNQHTCTITHSRWNSSPINESSSLLGEVMHSTNQTARQVQTKDNNKQQDKLSVRETETLLRQGYNSKITDNPLLLIPRYKNLPTPDIRTPPCSPSFCIYNLTLPLVWVNYRGSNRLFLAMSEDSKLENWSVWIESWWSPFGALSALGGWH